jgi:plasmid stabilization system protein ParE
MKIEFLDIAASELDDAFEYYEEIYQGLGRRFVEELELTLTRIESNPMAWQKAGVLTHRCLLHRFPYSIIYQIRNDFILVVAVACTHQEPNYWIERVEN